MDHPRAGYHGTLARAGRLGSRAGFSLIEVIVVMLITTSALMGVLSALVYGYDILMAQHDRRVAILLAQRELDFWKRTILFDEEINRVSWKRHEGDRIEGDWVYETSEDDPGSQRWQPIREPLVKKKEPLATSLGYVYREVVVKVRWRPRGLDVDDDLYDEVALTQWVWVKP